MTELMGTSPCNAATPVVTMAWVKVGAIVDLIPADVAPILAVRFWRRYKCRKTPRQCPHGTRRELSFSWVGLVVHRMS